MAKNERYVVGLDIGTTKISCVVAEMKDAGAVDVVGLGSAPSRGMRKDTIVNLDATVEAVRTAVEQAELMAGVNVESALVGIAGSHVRSFNSRGVIAVTGKDKTVGRDDVKRVLDAAQAVSIPAGRELIHVLPQEFVLDEQPGIANPVGMTGNRLEANVHIVTAATTAVQNLVTCVNKAGIEVRDIVLEQLATAEAVLTADERELGIGLVDIGGGTTDTAIFERGSLWHTGVMPVGGEHFTNDLAVGLRTPIPDAERIKMKHGAALVTLIAGEETIEVPTVGGRPARQVPWPSIAEILQPRAEELFSLLYEEFKRAGFERLLNAGIVLTGGGAQLPGIVDVAEQVFDMPVRLGTPTGFGGLTDPCGPSFAGATGLSLYGARYRPKPSRRPVLTTGALAGLTQKVGDLFRGMFSF